LPGAALAHLAEFRLEPVEENTATRVPERARLVTGPRFREMRASLGPPTDRSVHMTVRATDELSTQPRATQRGFRMTNQERRALNESAVYGPNFSPVTLVWDMRIR
jgi:hypothetical protein